MVDGNLSVIINTPPERGTLRHERVVRAIRKVENELDERLRGRELIGQIIDRKAVDRVRIKARRVTFTWQRGIKIGALFVCDAQSAVIPLHADRKLDDFAQAREDSAKCTL